MSIDVAVDEKVTRKAKLLKIHMKVCDRFSCSLVDESGRVIADQSDDYVPSFMPGDHFGDYVILDIDIETGQIANWEKPSAKDLEAWVNRE